ncbi:hypothetical protein DFH09DRAFT_1116846 [Mycena vulgaris]|nr:hypothetical protein DFH09DRAFT_1116846 [Mycena vulgaris]
MCDESTASKMVCGAQQNVMVLGRSASSTWAFLRKYWKYGFNSGNVYTHTARLNLDQYDIEAGPARTLPVPTLQDLLNPIPMAADPSEDSLFNNPRPDEESDAEDVEMAEADPSPRTASVRGPRVVRLSDAPRLAIEEYVNLQATALLARLEPMAPKRQGVML